MGFWSRLTGKRGKEESKSEPVRKPEPQLPWQEKMVPCTDPQTGRTVLCPKRLLGNPSLYKSYPITLVMGQADEPPRQFPCIGFGYEQPEQMVQRLCREGRLPLDWGAAEFEFPDWPKDWVAWSTSVRVARQKYLCEVEPGGESAIRVVCRMRKQQWERHPPVLYGCPRADMPRQHAALQNRKVDVITFD